MVVVCKPILVYSLSLSQAEQYMLSARIFKCGVLLPHEVRINLNKYAAPHQKDLNTRTPSIPEKQEANLDQELNSKANWSSYT